MSGPELLMVRCAARQLAKTAADSAGGLSWDAYLWQLRRAQPEATGGWWTVFAWAAHNAHREIALANIVIGMVREAESDSPIQRDRLAVIRQWAEERAAHFRGCK